MESIFCGTYRMKKIFVFGDKLCTQCAATSKRSGKRCLAPAVSGKHVCRLHGGKSTGPKTQAGLNKCIEAKTTHGLESRLTRQKMRDRLKLLQTLQDLGFEFGFMHGKRTPGRRN
jgi:hypothetical protein